MENEGFNNMESVYTTKVRAGKRRTYFFDVRKTKGEDFYITLTESTKRFNGQGYDRHKIFLYKEDFNRFHNGLTEVINHVKTELMPDFDYEQYERRQAEWEKENAANAAAAKIEESNDKTETSSSDETDVSEEDVSW
ncbi:MAG: DUF3276 family protein [Saprospiraceae bacterium]|nr:DUF3276 family protein [Saprospiraceae bacterium]